MNKSKIIKENWKEIKIIEEEVKKLKQDPEAGFNASSFFIGEKALMIPCMYRGKKGKKGQEVFTQKYSEIMVIAKYCPFSGKPLYENVELL